RTVIKRVAEVLGEANPLMPSRAGMILPALALAAAGSFATGPAVALPVWLQTPPGRKARTWLSRTRLGRLINHE
ncbi:MAG: hypothetical protein ACRDIU_02795, partial [Actinomycetota bacterium]